MLTKWLRENKAAAVLLTFLRLYVGWEWLTAGWHKITGAKPFDATGFLTNAIAKPIADTATHEAVYPTFVAFLKAFALPNVKLFNLLIPWGELLVGIGLILGVLTTTAMFFGLLMNFMYMFAGTVSTNPWLTLLGIILITAGANAGRFGVAYYVKPYVHHLVNVFKHHDHGHGRGGDKHHPAHA
ncbi:DoxX family protein [Paenibacillus cremeus]|uniref:DoxX family protein n=1 Tax=Paenibacillus cremeus TaxID=2163881 RepID=A0A559KIL6_9BACL|nr:DoxX family protein [Paenibacillus cremeus]TVY11983.1 DoxX family protein [Paenibacillus cremeus]